MKSAAKKHPNSKKDQTVAKLEKVVKELPAVKRREVLDFAQALLAKQSKGKSRKFKLDWAGGLREFRDQFTSLELQKKGQEWRIEHATRRH